MQSHHSHGAEQARVGVPTARLTGPPTGLWGTHAGERAKRTEPLRGRPGADGLFPSCRPAQSPCPEPGSSAASAGSFLVEPRPAVTCASEAVCVPARQVAVSEPGALCEASQFQAEPVEGRRVSKVVKTTVVRGERLEKHLGDPRVAPDLPSAKDDFEQVQEQPAGPWRCQ